MSEELQNKQTNNPRQPVKEKPFPDGTKSQKPKGVNPRAEMLASMYDNFDTQRTGQIESDLESDPDLRSKKRAIELAMGAADPNEKVTTSDQDTDVVDNDAYQNQQIDEYEQQQQHFNNDELSGRPKVEVVDNEGGGQATTTTENIFVPEFLNNYIEVHDGKPVMKMVVDGKTVYRDLETIQSQGQRYEAGEKRLDQLNQWSQQLSRQQAELKQLVVAQNNSQAKKQPSGGGATEFDVKMAAKKLAKATFLGTPEEAEAAFAETLTQLSQKAAPAQNVDELIDRAKEAAKQEYQEEAFNREVNTAWSNFQKNYDDVISDEEAFVFADSLMGKLEKENPDWTVEQAMSEAGKRARKLIVEGKKPETPPSDKDRRANKENLTQMPHPRNVVKPSSQQQGQRPQSPTDVLNEIRASRNQQAV